MSHATVAPAVADAATVPPSIDIDSDPIARENKRIATEAALTELERRVKDLWRRFFEPTEDPRPLSRRSRRSAWMPSDWP